VIHKFLKGFKIYQVVLSFLIFLAYNQPKLLLILNTVVIKFSKHLLFDFPKYFRTYQNYSRIFLLFIKKVILKKVIFELNSYLKRNLFFTYLLFIYNQKLRLLHL